MSESSVVARQPAANEQEFAAIFSAQRDYVYRLALALLGDAQDAEDTAQEVFLRVYKVLPRYDPARASLRTWLSKITVNACQSHRRRNFLRRLLPRQAKPADSEYILAVAETAVGNLPEAAALHAELRGALGRLLGELKPAQRATLVLYYYMDFSAAEIATVLGCAEGTVYSRLHYARRRLQRLIELHAPHLLGEVTL